MAPDPDGEISRRHWPDAGTTWPWIIYGRRTLPTRPFSIEALPLSRSYANQQNATDIAPEDEAVILPYILCAPGGYAGPFPQSTSSLPPPDPGVDRRGVRWPSRRVLRRFPGQPVEVQAHNNPRLRHPCGNEGRPCAPHRGQVHEGRIAEVLPERDGAATR
jgi:hypothetical protein